MRIAAAFASALTVACAQAGDDPADRTAVMTNRPAPRAQRSSVTPTPSAPEIPVAPSDAAQLSEEFDLIGCSNLTKLRDVRADGYLVESWRVRGGARCFVDWTQRQQEYALLHHLDASQAERDHLPWLCGESGGHVATCSTQERPVKLLIEQPRGAEFLLFRRLTKERAS